MFIRSELFPALPARPQSPSQSGRAEAVWRPQRGHLQLLRDSGPGGMADLLNPGAGEVGTLHLVLSLRSQTTGRVQKSVNLGDN